MELQNSQNSIKSAFKSIKHEQGSLTRGTRGVNGPTGQRPQNRGAVVDPRLLAGGEDSGEAEGTGMLASTNRI